MPRSLHRLTAIAVRNAATRGLLADGGGLYLQVSPTGTRAWVFRYMRDRRPRMMGLGAINAVTLAQARELAAAARNQLARGLDPLAERHAARGAARVAAAKRLSFRSAFERYVETQRARWTTGNTEQAWRSQFDRLVFPVLAQRMCDEIETPDVLAVIEPLWPTQPDMGNRIRGRIESVLGWATVSGFRTGENPARWRKHLDAVLPSPAQVAPTENYVALEYDRVPEFMAALRARGTPVALAAEFAILTAARISTVCDAQWSEFDLDAATWVIPGEAMKGKRSDKRPFDVPLSPRAIEVLRSLAGRPQPFGVNRRDVRELMEKLDVRTRDGKLITIHGTARSSFRDWAGETTSHPRDLLELCLAHRPGGTEGAYARGTALEKRRPIMADWARYCAGERVGSVVPLRKRA